MIIEAVLSLKSVETRIINRIISFYTKAVIFIDLKSTLLPVLSYFTVRIQSGI